MTDVGSGFRGLLTCPPSSLSNASLLWQEADRILVFGFYSGLLSSRFTLDPTKVLASSSLGARVSQPHSMRLGW